MKFLTLLSLASGLTLFVSCESTDSRKAGGGAFDDSYLGPRLDANAPLDDPSAPASDSYEQWRDQN
ncbi:MAG: hypothetical protein ACON5H_10065 [Akkermansiaceae bacterium]